jgi:acylphosphatase
MKKRVHVVYEGRVQGVGFRFTCQRIAEGLGLVGWVRNMPDGNVEVAVEGSKDEIDEFLSSLKNSMGRYISRENVVWKSFKGECKGFNIRF